ncbi:DUF4825 domain-containing protein [Paraliobacillus salinarum]|uniref:DUF4825 domain-containing protein n=1 Tax=Paraliobacillus salinarum TaxID=1158996 RepID=UPI001FE93ED5|nr:DUF4825 domain-containing protein [Paraliobacillus salinarum]
MIKWLLFSLLVMFLLSGCNSNSSNTDADLFQYKDSYVGDNSAVVNSVIRLQGEQHFSGIELKTKEKPYGITVNYEWSESKLNTKETVINNASYLFTLIQNVDWITFNFEMVEGMETYKITREGLQEWYGIEWNEVQNENSLNKIIKESLEDKKKVNQFLN